MDSSHKRTRGDPPFATFETSSFSAAVVELIDAPVEETRELNENIHLDLGAHGNLVSLTIEHARERANLPELPFSDGG